MSTENQVAPEHACPQCGERDIDALIWQEDETVTCWKCGCNYDPNTPQPLVVTDHKS